MLYPEISKSETFFEIFQEVFLWSFLLHPFFWILVFLSFFVSKYFISIFHRKIIAYALIFFIPLFLTLLTVLSIFNGEKPSNSLLYGTIFIIPVFSFCMIMFIQSSRFKNENKILKKEKYKIEKFGAKFQETSLGHQVLILMLFLLSLFSFTLFSKWAILTNYVFVFITSMTSIFFIYAIVIYNKMKNLKGKKMPFKTTDYIPFVIMLIIFASISTVKVGDFICLFPMFKDYFSC